jgi:hypothetical protein
MALALAVDAYEALRTADDVPTQVRVSSRSFSSMKQVVGYLPCFHAYGGTGSFKAFPLSLSIGFVNEVACVSMQRPVV